MKGKQEAQRAGLTILQPSRAKLRARGCRLHWSRTYSCLLGARRRPGEVPEDERICVVTKQKQPGPFRGRKKWPGSGTGPFLGWVLIRSVLFLFGASLSVTVDRLRGGSDSYCKCWSGIQAGQRVLVVVSPLRSCTITPPFPFFGAL